MKRNKKKVARLLLVSAMTFILSLGPLSIYSKAATYLTASSNNVTAYCGWTNETVQDAANGQPTSSTGTVNGTLVKTTITVDWGVVVSGTFSIKVAAWNSGSVFLCQDCRLMTWGITDTSAGLATFEVKGQDHVEIVYYHAYPSQFVNGFYGTWSKMTNSEVQAIIDVGNKIDAYMMSADNYNYLWSIDGNLQEILLDLDQDIIPSLDNIEDYLQMMLVRSAPLNSIYFSWNTSNESLGSGNVSNTNDPNLYIYKTGLSALTVKRVDARFSTQDVKDGNYMVLKWFFGMSGTGSASQYYDFPTLRFQWRDINGNMNNIGVFTYDSLNFTKFIEYNTTRNTYIVSVYVPISCFMASNNATFTYDFAIDLFELNNITTLGFMFGGMVDSLPYDQKYVDLLTQIAEGVGSMSGTTVNNTTTNINNYTTSFTEVNNIENNIMVDFSPSLTVVDQSITDSGVLTPSSDIAAGADWISYNFRLIQGIPLFKYPIYTILILFVAACLLG